MANRMSKDKAVESIRSLHIRIPGLRQLSDESIEFMDWRTNLATTIRHVFDDNSQHLRDFETIYFFPMSYNPMDSVEEREAEERQAYLRGLNRADALCKSMIYDIEKFWDDDVSTTIASYDKRPSKSASTNKVFVVHGRDLGARDTVTRFIESLGFEPIVLQEKPDQGRTVIEKFEFYADQASFTIIVATPDDSGGLKQNQDALESRARQNVIFELGYFVGKLGRSNVSLLVKGRVDFPSDYYGVLHTKLDEADGWKMKLMRELKDAGFLIDANRAV